MNIIQLRTWITNIGNGFIDKGANQCIQKAFNDTTITEVSGLGNKAANQTGLSFLRSYLKDNFTPFGFSYGGLDSEDYASLSRLMKADVAILAGCVLDWHLEWYAGTLRELSERDIPIILLGAGGRNYEKQTQERVAQLLTELNVVGLITRDDTAYNCYSQYVPHSYRGIDCGFFINEWYDPPKSNRDFTVATFDKIPEPELENDALMLRPYHKSLTSPMSGYLTEIGEITIQRIRQKKMDFFDEDNVIVSDLLEDYLFAYKNGIETHSDRVHACVPSLVYGNKARFYIDTPRANLFKGMTNGDISDELVGINRDKLRKHKSSQVTNLRKIWSEEK